MAATDDISHDAELQQLAERPGFFRATLALARRQPVGAVGGFIIFVMVFMAVFAPWITSHDHLAISFDDMLSPPGPEFTLGTDQFGRDILTRLIYGSRTALFIGFTCAFIGATTGLIFGVTSAYIGGKFDLGFQRLMDVFQAFPLIIMALAIVAIFGTSIANVMIAITIPLIPDCARVVRSSALAIRSVPYVDAARANGFSSARIILRHIAPNVMAPYLIMFTTFVGQAILLEASLSFLGLGVQEPTPAWGLMLQGGAEEYAESAPWVAIWPGVAISLAVFGVNLFGDALRDVLDPRLRTH